MKTQNICLEDIRDLIMTRTNEIRSMTDEELAMELLYILHNLSKSGNVYNFSHDYKDCTLACLQKESENKNESNY